MPPSAPSDTPERASSPDASLAAIQSDSKKFYAAASPNATDGFTDAFKTNSDYADICAKSQTEIGKTNVIKHKIITKDAAPISQPPYRCNPKYREFLQREITRMESQGLIRKSASPWARAPHRSGRVGLLG
ncbi:unnamed protein product [Rhizophagus irregularis]|nr:unnamed protein product [Rhizophagus irregularis]